MNRLTKNYARMLSRLTTRVGTLERSAQTGFRSIEGGRSIEIRDSNGELVGSVGGAPDGSIGTVDMVGTAPSQPTSPEVTPAAESIVVRWDGGFVSALDPQVTVAHVGVHLNQNPDDSLWAPTNASELAQITPGGGAVILPGDSGVETDVVLVAVSAAGVWSTATDPVQVIPAYRVDQDEVDTITADLELIVTDGVPPTTAPTVEVVEMPGTVYVSITPPANPDPITSYRVYVDGVAARYTSDTVVAVGVDAAGLPLPYDADTDFQVAALDADGEGPLSAVVSGRPTKIDSVDIAQDILDSIDAAGAAADAAQDVADAANAAAIAAAAAAAVAQNAADGAIRTYYVATAPSGLNDTTDLGDLWFDTDNGQAYRWGGNPPGLPGWVLIQDNAIASALAAAAAAQAAADAAAAAALTAQTSADGKNKVIYSAANPSAPGSYRLGDTWWKVTGGLIVGQWQHDGTNWVTAQIDNLLIANLDAGKITTGFLNVANLLQAGAITADKFAATLALVSTLQAGGNVTISPPTNVGGVLGGGILVLDPANPGSEPLVRLHPDGCTFKGKVITDILTVMQDLIVNGNASISSGAAQTLKNGVADPTAGPLWSQGPAQTSFPDVAYPYTVRGMCWDATNQRWIRLLEYAAGALPLMEAVSVAGVSSGGVQLGKNNSPTVYDWQEISGVTVLGSSIYYVGQRGSFFYGAGSPDGWSYRWMLVKCSLADGSFQQDIQLDSQIVYAGSTGGDGSLRRYHGLGNDGTNVFVTDGDKIKTFNASLTASAGSDVNISDGTRRIVRSIDYGNRGYGANMWTLGYADQAAVYPTTSLNPTKDAALTWTLDQSLNVGGLAYKTNGSNQGFYSHHSDQKISRWSDYYPAAGEKFWGKYLDFVGALHTGPSPITSVAVAKRRFAFATLRPAPGGVTGSELYVGYGSSVPANHYKRPETISGRVFNLLSGKDTSGTSTVPAGNNAGGTPGRLQSELGGFVVRGDGTGAWPLKDANANWEATCTSSVNVTGTTNTDIPGLSVNITSSGTSDVFFVHASFDVRFNASGSIANAIRLYVDGVARPSEIATNGPNGEIQNPGRTWRVTGLSAGSHTIKAMSQNFASTTVQVTTNSQLQIVKL